MAHILKTKKATLLMAQMLDDAGISSKVAMYAALQLIRSLVADGYVSRQHASEYLSSTSAKLRIDEKRLMNKPMSGLFDKRSRNKADAGFCCTKRHLYRTNNEH